MTKFTSIIKSLGNKGKIMPLPPQLDYERLAKEFAPAVLNALYKVMESRKIEANKEVKLYAIKKQSELYHRILDEKCKTLNKELDQNIEKKNEVIDLLLSKAENADIEETLRIIDKAIEVLKTPCITEETISAAEKISLKKF